MALECVKPPLHKVVPKHFINRHSRTDLGMLCAYGLVRNYLGFNPELGPSLQGAAPVVGSLRCRGIVGWSAHGC